MGFLPVWLRTEVVLGNAYTVLRFVVYGVFPCVKKYGVFPCVKKHLTRSVNKLTIFQFRFRQNRPSSLVALIDQIFLPAVLID